MLTCRVQGSNPRSFLKEIIQQYCVTLLREYPHGMHMFAWQCKEQNKALCNIFNWISEIRDREVRLVSALNVLFPGTFMPSTRTSRLQPGWSGSS